MAYGFYIVRTIDHTKIGTADLTNFVFVVDVTLADLKTVANGGKVQNANGFDIGFAAPGVPWKFQLAFYDGVAGRVIAWVQAPSISHTVDTTYWLTFGDPSISTDQSTTATWDGTFVAAYSPSTDGSTVNLVDMTGNGHTLTNHGTVAASTTSPLKGSVDVNSGGFPSGSQWLESIISSGLSSSFSISAWFFPRNYPYVGSLAAIALSDVANTVHWAAVFADDGPNNVFTDVDDGTNSPGVDDGLASITANTWNLGQLVFAKGSTIGAARNGSTLATTADTTTTTPSYSAFRIGSAQESIGSRSFDGLIGEVRVANLDVEVRARGGVFKNDAFKISAQRHMEIDGAQMLVLKDVARVMQAFLAELQTQNRVRG